MNVARILGLAQVYSNIKWQDWSAFDLSEIHQLLTALAQKHTIKYEIEMIADESVELDETTPRRSKTEVLHNLITHAIIKDNLFAVRAMLQQMLVMSSELVENEKSKNNAE